MPEEEPRAQSSTESAPSERRVALEQLCEALLHLTEANKNSLPQEVHNEIAQSVTDSLEIARNPQATTGQVDFAINALQRRKNIILGQIGHESGVTNRGDIQPTIHTRDSREDAGEPTKPQRHIEDRLRNTRERTERFVETKLETFLRTSAARAAGRFSIFDRIDEHFSRRALERESIRLQNEIIRADERLRDYKDRRGRLQSTLDRYRSIAESRPAMKVTFDNFMEDIGPKMVELQGLISRQEALIQEYGQSLRTLAGGASFDLPAMPIAGIRSGIPDIDRQPEREFAEEQLDNYLNVYDTGLGHLFGTVDDASGLPEKFQGQRSAVANFFKFVLGIEI